MHHFLPKSSQTALSRKNSISWYSKDTNTIIAALVKKETGTWNCINDFSKAIQIKKKSIGIITYPQSQYSTV